VGAWFLGVILIGMGWLFFVFLFGLWYACVGYGGGWGVCGVGVERGGTLVLYVAGIGCQSGVCLVWGGPGCVMSVFDVCVWWGFWFRVGDV